MEIRDLRYITGAILKTPECTQVFKNTRGSLSWHIWRNIRKHICPVASTVLQSTSVCQHWDHEPGSVLLCLWQESDEDSSLLCMAMSYSVHQHGLNLFFFLNVLPTLGHINSLHGYIPKASWSWVSYTIQGHSPELYPGAFESFLVLGLMFALRWTPTGFLTDKFPRVNNLFSPSSVYHEDKAIRTNSYCLHKEKCSFKSSPRINWSYWSCV